MTSESRLCARSVQWRGLEIGEGHNLALMMARSLSARRFSTCCVITKRGKASSRVFGLASITNRLRSSYSIPLSSFFTVDQKSRFSASAGRVAFVDSTLKSSFSLCGKREKQVLSVFPKENPVFFYVWFIRKFGVKGQHKRTPMSKGLGFRV